LNRDKARNSLLALLKRIPHDLAVLEELRPILIELSDLSLCAQLYEAALAHYSETFPMGHGINPETAQEVPGGGYGLMEILVLADLFNTMGDFEKAIRVIRSGCRWLQGRGSQKLWDSCEDDREYDEADWRTVNGRERELPPGKYPLDVNARHRLAVARIKMGDIEEGVVCMPNVRVKLYILRQTRPMPALFWARKLSTMRPCLWKSRMHILIEKCTLKPGLFTKCLARTLGYAPTHFVTLLLTRPQTSSLHVLLQVATCYHMLGQLQDAAEVYETSMYQ
jgi:general transcription factor 3C polypeptide 3 (transcription factor C subunit 4)